jgi:hypothetical protein
MLLNMFVVKIFDLICLLPSTVTSYSNESGQDSSDHIPFYLKEGLNKNMNQEMRLKLEY